MTAYYTLLCPICEHPIKLGQAVPGMVADWHHEDVSVCRENIRADERAKCDPGFIGTAMKLMADERADLATKVQALPTRGVGARVIDGELVTYALVERDEVLALFGGESDD